MMTLDTPEISLSITRVDGHPAGVMHDRTRGEFIEYVNIDRRFFVYISGKNCQENCLTAFNNATDFRGLASLG